VFFRKFAEDVLFWLKCHFRWCLLILLALTFLFGPYFYGCVVIACPFLSLTVPFAESILIGLGQTLTSSRQLYAAKLACGQVVFGWAVFTKL